MQKNGRGTYESALIYVAKEFGIGEKTVRDAYNKHKKNDLGQE
jgi:DNA-binding transcriptional regulator PaaX